MLKIPVRYDILAIEGSNRRNHDGMMLVHLYTADNEKISVQFVFAICIVE